MNDVPEEVESESLELQSETNDILTQMLLALEQIEASSKRTARYVGFLAWVVLVQIVGTLITFLLIRSSLQ